MPVTRTVDRQQRRLARMLATVEEMIAKAKACLQGREEDGDASHAG